jgi:hypothetical protein
MAEELTAYICGEGEGSSIVIESVADRSDVTTIGAGSIETKIRPNILSEGCYDPVNARVIARLKPDPLPGECNPICGYIENAPTDMVYWEYPEDDDFPTLHYWNSDHCQWIQTLVVSHGPEENEPAGDLIVQVDVGGAPGSIQDDKDDVFSGGGIGSSTIDENSIVPGMLIEIDYRFTDGENLVGLQADVCKWQTPTYAGGVVKAVSGAYDSESTTYTVQVFGANVSGIKSTDWVEWAVGDWVFICLQDKDGEEIDPTGEGWSDPGSACILPMEVGNYGA